MAKTKANEREFQGQVIAWIKEQISHGGLPFENATNDSSLYDLKGVKFPDVLVTLDFECLRPFCGWELKTPKTDARDAGLLKDAVKKAQTIEAKYFVTWNMQTAIIWRTPPKTRTTVKEEDKEQEFGPDYRITDVSDIRDRVKAELLKDMCRRLVIDLGLLYEDEKINLPLADTTFFVKMIAGASERMADAIVNDLNRKRASKSFDKGLDAWAKKQGVNKYDQDYRHTLAQQIAYKIIGKILFYITLRRQNLRLPKMELRGDNYKGAMKRMRGLFQLGLEVDYQAIFEPDITDEIELSKVTAKEIIQLTETLSHWSFELMPLDVIGYIFEKLVPQEARHSLGQYFTPDNLVDLIVEFCVRNGDDFLMDPTCGTGTFLIRSYNRLRNLSLKRKTHRQLINQVWGFDIAGFPAELATINLYRQDLSDYLNFPRVMAKDFFDVMPGAEFEFPPPKRSADVKERISVKIPRFDALVGNFPFIRQELIEKANKGYKDKLEEVLFESWSKEYPSLFREVGTKTEHRLQLSGQADIYAYLFFHAAAHLKVGGRMGFVTSNSWLDVAYGYELQKFFLKKFKIIGIFESRCEPWFEQSAVNTVFTILERCDDEKEIRDNPVRFVKVKKRLAELFPQDAATDAQSRWIRLGQFVDKVEEIAYNSARKKGFKKFALLSEEYIRQPEFISYEDDEVRVRIVKQSDLKGQVEETGQTVKWGQYLRGPDVYFEILQKCANKMVPLSEIADLRRGITTGINEFFYLTKEQAKYWSIEKNFIKPVITTTREIPTIFVEEKKLTKKIFICNKEKKDLRGTGALKYIRDGEKQVTKDQKRWPDVPSVKNRRYWYSLAQNEVSDFLILRFRDERHYTPVNTKNLPVGDTVFVGEFKNKSYKKIGFAFLNSVLTALFAEVFGRTNLGDGLLTTYGPEIRSIPLPLRDVKKLDKKNIEKALNIFRDLGKRKVFPFNEEIQRKDRKEFEKAIFNCVGLDENDYKEICQAVKELMSERFLLPKLRTKQKKKRTQQNLEKLREEIGEEVLGSGVRRFPEGFVKGWGKVKCGEISVPVSELKLGESFFDKQEICEGEGKHLMEVATPEKAKFIVYAKKKDEYVVRVPESSVMIKKAVQDYEIYVKEKRDALYTAIMEKCGDHSVSENLARQICEEYGLPDVR